MTYYNRSRNNFRSHDLDDRESGFVAEKNESYNIERIDNSRYQIKMAVPGYRKEDIEITFNNNILKIKAIKRESFDERDVQFLHKGIHINEFENSFSLNSSFDLIDATLDHGILTITLQEKHSYNDNIINPIR